MPYCPKCHAEYKDGRDECIDCGVPLIDEELEENDESDFVPLRTVPSRVYAQMLKESLENEGIPAIIKGEDAGEMLGTLGTATTLPIEIWVPADEIDRAEEVANAMMGKI